MDINSATSAQIEQAVTKLEAAIKIIDDFIHGGTDVTIKTRSGDLKPLLGLQKDFNMNGVKWNRAKAATITNVQQALNALDVNVWEFAGLITDKPDPLNSQTWDWQPAFQAAIDYIMTAVSRVGGNGTAFSCPTLKIPANVYCFKKGLVIKKTNTSTYPQDFPVIKIVGDGMQNTKFKVIGDNVTLFSLTGVRPFIQDFSVEGNTTTVAFKLGEENVEATDLHIQQVQRANIKNINIQRVFKGMVFAWVMDSIFENIFIGNLAGGTATNKAVALDILQHKFDNSNFVTINQLHIEGVDEANSILLRARGGNNGSSNFNQNFTFVTPHFETRRYDAGMIDLEGCFHFRFINCVGTRSNDNQSITYTSSQPAVRIGNYCREIVFDGGNFQHIGTSQSDMPRLLKYEGSSYGVTFKNTRFFPANSSSGQSLNNLLDNQSADSNMATHRFESCYFGEIDKTSFTTSSKVSSRNSANYSYTHNYDTANNFYKIEFNSNTNGQMAKPVLSISQEGMLQVPYRGVKQVTIKAGETLAWYPPNTQGLNPNNAGRYSIIGFDPSGLCEFYHNYGVMQVVSSRTETFAVGVTDPQVANRINVYSQDGVTNNAVRIRNGLTKDVTIALDFVGFMN